MKIENLKVGQIIKNYEDLTKVLEIEFKPSNNTNGRKSQKDELSRYVKYHNEGRKFIIDEIYSKPIPKEKPKMKENDGRKNNKGGNNIKYSDDIEFLILCLLEKFELNKNEKVGFSKNLLYSHCGLVNNNYSFAKGNIKLFSECTFLPHQVIAECFDYTNNKLHKTLITALNRLKRRSIITWGNGYNLVFMTKDGKRMRVASVSEEKEIMKIERRIMKEMGHENKRFVFTSGKWKSFKRQVEKELKEKYDCLLFYYDSITFNYNNEEVKAEIQKIVDKSFESAKLILNTNFSKGLDETIERRKMEFFGASLNAIENYRASEEYVDEQKEVKNFIINLDSKEFVFFEEKDGKKILVKPITEDAVLYKMLREEFEERYSYENNESNNK